MRKYVAGLVWILVACDLAHGLSDVTVPNTFSTGDTIKASKFNANFDTLEVNWARLNDSLEEKFMRFYDLESGDSTLGRLQADTIVGVDTLYSTSIKGVRLTTTGTATVDSMSSTKGIKATTGTFSSSITGTTVNTGQGDNELYDMDQNVLTTSSVTFDSAFSTKAVRSADGIFTDDVTITDDLSADSVTVRTLTTTGNIGIGTSTLTRAFQVKSGNPIVSIYNDGNDALIGTATGQAYKLGFITKGTGRLYLDTLGNVGIGTDAPAAKLHVSGGGVRADSLYAGTAGWFTVNSGTFPCSLFDGSTFRAAVTAKYQTLGSVAHVHIPTLQGTITGSTSTYIRSIPSALRVTDQQVMVVPIYDNAATIGRLYLNTGSQWTVTNSATGYLNAGTQNFTATSFTYLLQ